jgi:hypothetical protein
MSNKSLEGLSGFLVIGAIAAIAALIMSFLLVVWAVIGGIVAIVFIKLGLTPPNVWVCALIGVIILSIIKGVLHPSSSNKS